MYTRRMRLLQCAMLLLNLLHIVHTKDSANCTQRVKLCNGIMCQDSCVIGTVETDPWVDAAMSFIREIQRHEPLVRTTMIGTHNSAISQAYGFGIEQDYLESLVPGFEAYQGDDLGEGVCNTFSVLDQLRFGLRHIEIDINSGYFNVPFSPGRGELNKIYVCHSPIPLDPKLIVEANLAAKRQNVSLGWSIDKLSCIGTRVPFREMLGEIKRWMDDHPEEILVLYLDAKPGSVSLKSQCKAAYDDMEAVFGDLIWAVADGDPRRYSRAQMLARGKRVIFEDHDDGFTTDARRYVFTPALWDHQMGQKDVAPFPDCSIQGESFASWYAPITFNESSSETKELVRGLGWGRVTQGDAVANAMDCAVNILSSNYIQPLDVEGYVWAVDRAGWSPEAKGCMAILPTGKMGIAETMATADCRKLTPHACRKADDDTVWTVETAPCKAGFVRAAPTTGYALKQLALAAGGKTVFVDVTPDGRLF